MHAVASSREVTPEEAKAELWRRGELSWKLYDCQKPVYDAVRAGDGITWINEIGRQVGKSIIDGVVLLEEGLRGKNRQLLYAAPTGVMVNDIFVPNLRILCEDAPEDIRPIIKGNKVLFPSTGSVIKMAGCEDELKADRLRGPFCHFAVVDEAGFIPILDYVLKSVIGPQLLTTRPDSRMLISSTPSRKPGHPFTILADKAEEMGTYCHRSIYDSTVNGTPEKIEDFKALCGDGDPRVGEQTEEWKVEYEAQRAEFGDRSIIPEFGAAREFIVQPVVPPEYYEPYVGMDLGDSPSLTAILFGYWDFKEAMLCIQRAVTLDRPTTADIALAVSTGETELWAADIARWKEERPFHDRVGLIRRVTDIDHRLIADMSQDHGLLWSPARKDNRDAAINRVRMDVGSHRMRIDPEGGKPLISHLKAGSWNKRRTDFEFQKGFGHFDCIPALVYLRRHIVEQSNPWPTAAQQAGPDQMVTRRERRNQGTEALEDLFR